MYVVGIDLGTTNSVLAFWQAGSDGITVLDVEQILRPGSTVKQSMLPSVSYLPYEGEVQAEDLGLAWEEKGAADCVVGLWARERGAQMSDRLISSAKSWLCTPDLDRRSAFLPWQSDVGGKQSPIEALASYLRHLKGAFEQDRRENGEELDLGDIEVILTVPASFDEVARNLTYEAAQMAGLKQVSLLEEPQAAFYSWIARLEKNWREQVEAGDVVLVCDVGGGTTDFSLIAVSDVQGNLQLERMSVGEHLLLGGDNMDLALAYALKAKLAGQGSAIDRWQLLSLVSNARVAKEKLLNDASLDEVPISVTGKSSSLFAKTITTKLTRQEVTQVLLEGFFPASAVDELPRSRLSAGLQEMGLPYESEPAITKHLARFLKRSRQNIESNENLRHLSALSLQKRGCEGKDYILPTAILFNGGVFNASLLRERVLRVLQTWGDGQPTREIVGSHLDLAVAHGAAYFGKTKASGEGIRIAAGTARSYYLGLESAMMAVPGVEPELKGLCVVPQGTEEGVHLKVPGRQFGLVTGQPAVFRFFSSSVRAGDQLGDVIEGAREALEETSSVSVSLSAISERESELVPVALDAYVTEVGTLQLAMQHVHSERKWNLEFNVRR